jgi:hypothetical protein
MKRDKEGKFTKGKFVEYTQLTGIVAGLTVGSYILGALTLGSASLSYAANRTEVQVIDMMPEKIEALKDEVVRDLSDKCEFKNKQARPDTLDPKESGGYQISYGDFQWEVNTLIEKYRKMTGTVLSYDEAIIMALDEQKAFELAKWTIFIDNDLKRWRNCARDLKLQDRVDLIKKLYE